MMEVSGAQGTHEGHPYGGGDASRRHVGTLTPLVPLSPSPLKAQRACPESLEGERRTEGYVGAAHPRSPLVQYWGEGGEGR